MLRAWPARVAATRFAPRVLASTSQDLRPEIPTSMTASAVSHGGGRHEPALDPIWLRRQSALPRSPAASPTTPGRAATAAFAETADVENKKVSLMPRSLTPFELQRRDMAARKRAERDLEALSCFDDPDNEWPMRPKKQENTE
jgi:hypothetical protein